MFFFKKKQIVLDCFTKIPYVYDHAKIDHAIKYVPEWWKKTPKLIEGKESGTVKNCIGFIDYYKKGFVMPSWFELNLTIHKHNDPENRWYSFTGSNDDVDLERSHAPYQFEGFAGFDGKNIKINSPWGFKTKDEIYFTATQPTWNMRANLEQLTLLPAVVNFKYQNFLNVNYFVTNREYEQHCSIKPLTPLIMLHPMSDRKITVKNHLVSEKEWDRLFGIYNLVIKDENDYQKKKELHETIEKQKKCPFH